MWSVACQQSRLYLQHHLLHHPLWKSGHKPVMWRWFDTFCRSDNMICSLWQVAEVCSSVNSANTLSLGTGLDCLFHCTLSALLCSKNGIKRCIWFALMKHVWNRGSTDITHRQIEYEKPISHTVILCWVAFFGTFLQKKTIWAPLWKKLTGPLSASPQSCLRVTMNLSQASRGMNGCCLLTAPLSHGPLPEL